MVKYIQETYSYKYKGTMPKNTEITLNEGIVDIAGDAFEGQKDLISIYIPNSVKIIGPYAFYNCINLSNINIPNNLNIIYDYAFNTCKSISDIILPNTVSSLGTYIFENCTNLENIILSTTLTSIPTCTFRNCTKLESIILPNNITTIGSEAFSNCTSLQSIIDIPDSVTTIGSSAFNHCRTVEIFNIGYGVNSIGSYAFDDTLWYDNLEDGWIRINNVLYSYKGDKNEISGEIIVEDGITYITQYTLREFENVTSIVLPSSLTYIAGYMFMYNDELISITCLAINPPTITNTTFNSISNDNMKVYVPSEALDEYKSAQYWSNISNRILPIE